MRVLAASVLSALAVVLCCAARAESQLPRQGAYGAHFWWQGHGKWHEVEKDHTVFVGEIKGTFFNDSGGGFLHSASAVCPSVRDVLKGVVSAHGYCVWTDEDGDRATFAWKCKGREHCVGDAEWISGSGKYTGIKGSQTFSAEVLNPLADSGRAIFKGRWRLPD